MLKRSQRVPSKYGWRARKASEERSLRRSASVKSARKAQLGRRIVPFLANKRTTQHVYGSQYSVSLTSGTSVMRVFRGNGMYDPDRTGTGHQPYGFDQLSALYKYYSVRASSIKVWYVTSSAGTGVLMNVTPDATAATTPTISAITEMFEMFRGDPVFSTNTDGSHAIISKSESARTRDIMIGDWKESSNLGTGAADPTNQWSWNVAVYNGSGVTTAGNLFVRITYDVTWSEPQDFAQS